MTPQLWDDPAYVTQQARERLELVMPGETLYSVTGRPSETDTDTETETRPHVVINHLVASMSNKKCFDFDTKFRERDLPKLNHALFVIPYE